MPKAPTVETAACAVCGYEGKLLVDGEVYPHQTRRVNRRGKTYTAKDKCLGSNELPEPLGDVSGGQR